MDNKKYEALILIAENGSITRTAAEMGYTQSGVTQMINSLETELGITLLVRTNKGAVLTNSGKALLPFFREEHNCELMIQQECDLMLGRETGTVNVGCLSSISAAWMPAILQSFATRHPGIRINMRENETPEITKMLDEGRIDIALTELSDSAAFNTTLLMQDEIKAIVPRNHPLAAQASVTMKELCGYPFVSYSTGDTGTSEIGWPELATENKFKFNIMYSCKDDLTAIRMVEHELGVSIAGSLMLMNYTGQVKELPIAPPLYRSLGIMMKSGVKLLPATRSFISCVLETMPAIMKAVSSHERQ